MATLEDLEARIAALEASQADYRAVLAAVNALGANQRDHALGLAGVTESFEVKGAGRLIVWSALPSTRSKTDASTQRRSPLCDRRKIDSSVAYWDAR